MEIEDLKSHSQARQDTFAIVASGGKRDGTFVDIGAGHPENGSNTKALEELGWRGILCDIETWEELAVARSQSNVILADALDPDTDAEILKLAGDGGTIDFLSLDLEPPALTLQRLATLPLHRVRFAIACVEHDLYRDPTGSIRAAMRGIMSSHGYRMVAADVMMVGHSDGRMNLVPVEDWWIHPSLVDERKAILIAKTVGMTSLLEMLDHIGTNVATAGGAK
jgi:hypothetical protein